LVEVNVIVEDRKGNPVTDLTKDDFTVLDGNKPQAISDFSMQATHLLARTPAALAKNTFTNRFEDRPGVPTSVTVVLFDALNTHFRDLAAARQQMLKFIGQMQPEDRVAIFGLADDLIVIQDFTSDQQALINAVRKSTTPENQHAEATDVQASDTGDDGLDEFLDEMNQMESDFYNRDRALRTADALTAIANYIGRLPGRKNLVWVSSAFPLEINFDATNPPIGGMGSSGQLSAGGTASRSGGGRSNSASSASAMPSAPAFYQPDQELFDDQVEAAAEALDNANVAVYPVDARGLIPLSTMDASRRGSAVAQAIRRRQPPPNGLPPQANFDTMNEIADRTGGHAYYNTNDIAGSVRKAIDDSRVTYVLSYYPDHGQWNGKFREIKIKIDRPDLDVRYRRGYLAIADTAPAPIKRHFLLQNALDAPVDSTTIGMTVEATLAGSPGAQRIRVRIRADSQAIVLLPQGNQWTAALDFLVAQWDDKNKLLKVDTPTFNVRMTQADRAAWEKSGFDVEFETGIEPGASRIRFAGCDEQSGATGSVTVPIKSLVADSR
jgi:VWFA-related protein